MRDVATYAFINARIRAMYGDSLSADQWECLLKSRDVVDALAVLRDTPYFPCINNEVSRTNDLSAIETELRRRDLTIHRKIQENTPASSRARKVIALVRERYEIDEVKSLLRCWHTKGLSAEQAHIMSDAFVHTVAIDRALSARTRDEFTDAFRETPYHRILVSSFTQYPEAASVFFVESNVDRDYFDRLWHEIDRLPYRDRAVAARLTGIEIDIENMCALIRLRQYYAYAPDNIARVVLPRGYRMTERVLRDFFRTETVSDMIRGMAVRPYQDLTAFGQTDIDRSGLALMERLLYQVLLKESRRVMRGFPFTIGTLMAYLTLKRAETSALISLLYGKNYGFEPDRIRGVLLC